MIENNYQKKIMPYLDGTLTPEEQNEFEAHLMARPEIQEKVNRKREELELILNLIPKASLTDETRDSLEDEIKSSVFHLLKDDRVSFWDEIKNRFEELISR